LAKDLGDVLILIVDTLRFLARNFDEVKDVLIALVGLKAAAWLGSIAMAARGLIPLLGGLLAPLTANLALFRAMPAAAGAAATSVTLLGTALGFLGRAIPVLGALWLAWEVGTSVLNAWTKASERARNEKEKLAGGKGGAPTASKITDLESPPKPGQRMTPDPGTAVNSSQMAAQDINKALDKNQKKIDEANQAARMKGAKAELEQRQLIATEELRAMRDRATTEIKDEKLKGEALARIDKQIAQTRLNEKLKFENQMAGATKTRVDKERQLIEDIDREMAAVE
jgi:hypothetical protein